MLFIIFFVLLFSNKVTVSKSEAIVNPIIDYTEILEVLNKLPRTFCTQQLLLLGNGLMSSDMWALKMLDATAKPQSGILLGNIMHVGNYDECLEINKDYDRSTLIEGQYCTARFGPHPKYGNESRTFFATLMQDLARNDDQDELADEARLTYGFCLPKICSAEDLQEVVDILEEAVNSSLHFTFEGRFCDGGDGQKFTNTAIGAIIVFSIFAFLLVFGTMYEYFVWKEIKDSEKQPNILMAFSVITNGRKILSTAAPEGSMHCLNGFRVISMMWVVLAHGFQYSFYVPHVNALKITEWQNEKKNAVLAASAMAVDTFFVISGLLVTFLFMKSQARGAKFNIPMFYIHRLLRLTPALAMICLFTGTLLIHTGNGPFWPIIDEMFQKPCETNWWSTLIYLQTYINPDDQCVGQAWYVAVDTQMYFISPLILFPLIKWPKQIIGAMVVFIMFNCGYVFEATFKKNLGTTFLNQNAEQYRLLYSPAYIRGTAYLVGMICGYFVYQTTTGKLNLKLTKGKIIAAWAFPLLTLFTIILGHSFMIAAPHYSALDSAFFNALTRVGWSFALSIIILLCVNDYGGVINSFLSSSIFTVLIRLNYSVYLVHLNILAMVMAQGRTPTYFSNLLGYHRFFGDYAFSLGASVIWTLAFESPVIAIEKIVFGKRKTKIEDTTKADVVAVQVIDNLYGLQNNGRNK